MNLHKDQMAALAGYVRGSGETFIGHQGSKSFIDSDWAADQADDMIDMPTQPPVLNIIDIPLTEEEARAITKEHLSNMVTLADQADNTLSTVDEELEDAMRTKFYADLDEAKHYLDTPEGNKAESEWQAEKDLCE